VAREIVVYDTNAYRSIGRRHLDAVQRAQREHSVVPVVSKFVAFELISACYGDTARDAMGAWHGLHALARHTQLWDGRPYIPFTQSHIEQRVLSPAARRDDAAMVSRLGQLILQLAECATPPINGPLAEASREIRTYVLEREAAYGDALHEASQMAAALMLEQSEAGTDREAQLGAMRFLRKRGDGLTAEIFAMLGEGFDEDSPDVALAREATWMQQHAATAIAFMHHQIVLAAGREIDPRQPRHANSVWDARVCALIDLEAKLSADPRFNGAPVFVVTSEAQILAAAQAAGHRSRVRSLGEHCDRIGLAALAQIQGWLPRRVA